MFLFSIFIQDSVAQIKINSSGDIGIGTTGPSADVHILGDEIRIESPDDLYGDGEYIKIHHNYGHPVIEPSVNNTGYIGTSSSSQFYYAYFKYARVNNVQVTSDIRVKKNIKEIDASSAFAIINQLRPIKYDMIEDLSQYKEKQKEEVAKSSINNYGFSAQEVEKILPQIVFTEDDSLGLKSINYIAFIPILVKAIKEQQSIIEELLEKDKEQLKSLKIDDVNSSTINATLSQNHPNPFSNQTEISFYIPGEISNATINVYNLNGALIHSYSIQERGKSTLVIAGYEFDPGIYLYNMILDNQVVDTKQMVLTD